MSFAFKKFTFFQHTEVQGHAYPKNATCCAPSPACVHVGCDNGSVQLLDSSFQLLASFPAHGYRVQEAIWLERGALLTLGTEAPGCSSATIKVWDTRKLLASLPQHPPSSHPPPSTSLPPLRVCKVFGPKLPEGEITALAAHEGAHVGATTPASGSAAPPGQPPVTVAVGLATGMVYVLTLDAPLPAPPLAAGAAGQGKAGAGAGSAPTAPAPPRAALAVTKLSARPESGDACAVMGVALVAEGGPQQAATPSSLFVVTETQTLCFHLQTSTKAVLDHTGVSAPHCCVLRPPTSPGAPRLLLVGREEGLYDYTPDTRAGCTVYEGGKARLAVLRRYVVVVTREVSEVGATSCTVTLADTRNKMTAGGLTLSSVTAVFPLGGPDPLAPSSSSSAAAGAPGRGPAAGGASHAAGAGQQLAVVTGSGKLYLLKEADLAAQLEVLYRRGLHRLALDIARANAAPPHVTAAIQQRWGDALYAKGEYDAAMVQYGETVGHLEPSYVIRRFLDAQRIHNLTSYLELLHARGLAGADHTTLLLSCYTRLKDVAKLDAFCGRSVGLVPEGGAASKAPAAGAAPGSVASAGAAGELGTASAAGSSALAFDAETAVRVLRAAGYARHALAVAQAAGQVEWQLDILLEDCGAHDEALALLETLPREARAGALKRQGRALVRERPEATTRALMDLCLPPPPGSTAGSSSAAAADTKPGAAGAGGPVYTASIADFAPLYADTPTALLLLAEFLLNSAPPGGLAHEGLLYHTLLELYLADHLPDAPASDPAAAEAERGARRAKALDLLHAGWPAHLDAPRYSADHALVLCRTARFMPGLVLLYDRLRAHREVLRVHMEAADYAGLIGAVTKYGDASRGGDPQLWAEVLQYFVEQGGCEAEVAEVVARIEAGGVLPPLVVLQLLARSRELKVGAVRGYIGRQLAREAAAAARDREGAARLAGESASLKAEVGRLRSQARVFQASRCAASGGALELPAVHFLCGHSFNARALGDNDRECPLCGPDLRRVLDIRKNLAASATQQDKFFTELREAGDGFSVVAAHFGRGLMNHTAAATSAAGGAGGLGTATSGVIS